MFLSAKMYAFRMFHVLTRKSFNVFIVFAKIIFSSLIYWFRKIKLLILCFEYKKYANPYEAWEICFQSPANG